MYRWSDICGIALHPKALFRQSNKIPWEHFLVKSAERPAHRSSAVYWKSTIDTESVPLCLFLSQNHRSLVAFSMRPLGDMNEITSHMLEVVQAHMVLGKSHSMVRRFKHEMMLLLLKQKSENGRMHFHLKEGQQFNHECAIRIVISWRAHVKLNEVFCLFWHFLHVVFFFYCKQKVSSQTKVFLFGVFVAVLQEIWKKKIFLALCFSLGLEEE